MFDPKFWLNHYPGTNFHELNIDWLVETVKKLAKELEEYEIVNQIHYAGHWNITKQYPAWSVVVDTSTNTGYISLKPVPAGIDINNSEYWEMIAEFTSIIGDLADRVTDLENKMAAPKKTYILIGDSFSLGVVGGGQPRGTGWAMYAETHIPEYNERCFRYHPEAHEPIEGVAGFAGGVFLQYLQAVGEELTCPADEVTDIIVLGGSNEFSFTQAMIEASIGTFCDYCKAHYVNAHVHIGLIGLQADRLYNDVYPAYINGAIKNGANYIDTALNLMANPAFDSGYGHITANGYNFINPYVMEIIRFGRTTYKINFDLTASLDTDYVINESGSFDYKVYFTVTEKSINIEIDESLRYNPFILKLVSAAGSTSLSGTAFTLSADTYIPIKEAGELKVYIRENSGYQYTPVRSGHFYIDEHNKIKYSAGFPYFNTWSSAGIDSPDNSCYLIWERSYNRSI